MENFENHLFDKSPSALQNGPQKSDSLFLNINFVEKNAGQRIYENKITPNNIKFSPRYQNIEYTTSTDLWNRLGIDNRFDPQSKLEAGRIYIKETTLDKLSILGQNIESQVVTAANFQKVQSRLLGLLQGPEQIHQNIDLNFGDIVVWNPISKMLTVSDGNKTKFSIRFAVDSNINSGDQSLFSYTESGIYNIDSGLGGNRGYAEYAMDRMRNNLERFQGNPLGEWLVRNGPYPGRKNSCGASVGKLLNKFLHTNLGPGQIGPRHGKNWGNIIKEHLSDFFVEIDVPTPEKAPYGCILVYEGGAQAPGISSERRSYGHVEIKGNDGMYYSYYKSSMPGGSAKVSMDIDPAEYQRLTGFTGKAYVYNPKYSMNTFA